MSSWEWFEHHPNERETFAHAMMGLTVGQAPVVATRYPFQEVQTVCDLGGGRGTLLSEILVRHPHLRGILADAQGVLESARSLLERRGLTSRVDFVPCNFFEDPIPPGADLYILKNVLHDWDVPECEQLIRRTAAALPAGGRLLIHDAFLHDDHSGPLYPALFSVALFLLTEGRNYSAAEYKGWLQEAGLSTGEPTPTLVHSSVLVGTKS